MSDQRARQEQAERLIKQLLAEKATGERALALLRQAATDERQIHFTPHLITALRDAGYWPAMERAEKAKA